MRSRLYATVGCPSVGLSARLSVRPPHAAAANLLLWAQQPEDNDRLLHDRQAGGQQHGAQQ